MLSNAKIEFEFRTDPLSPREAWQSAGRDDGPPVVAMLSRSLKLDEPAVGESRALELISAERHFLRAHDERVAAFCAGMPGSRKAHFHMSLDDSVMQIFGGKWVADTLRRLGQGEDEPIESAMVSRRLLQAQERFSQRAIADEQADSPAEWLRINAPDMAG